MTAAREEPERRSDPAPTSPPLVASRDAPLGGQAVIEGVMMRGVSTWAVAVRAPSAEQLARGRRMAGDEPALGDIQVTSFPLVSVLKRHRWLRWPIIRGVVALGESLRLGFRALNLSINTQLPDGEGDISRSTWAGTIALALLMAIGLFFLLPVTLTSLAGGLLPNAIVFVIVEKLIRIAIFLAYLWAVSRRGPGVRGHQVVRAQPLQALGADPHAAGNEAAAAHHARARPRSARCRHRRPGGRARRRVAQRRRRGGPGRDGGRGLVRRPTSPFTVGSSADHRLAASSEP